MDTQTCMYMYMGHLTAPPERCALTKPKETANGFVEHPLPSTGVRCYEFTSANQVLSKPASALGRSSRRCTMR